MKSMSKSLFQVLLTFTLMFTVAIPANAELEEIVVTAQKREENVQDVPISITVLSSDQIESSFSNNFENLQKLIPSVNFRKGNTTRNSAISVRGIGTVSFSIGAEPSVSSVVDNVVMGRSGQAFSALYDLERVEVLRGPQGTLFGKNASAGVVNITTKGPSEEFEGYVDLSIYEDDETRLKARLSGPLSENVRGSLNIYRGDFDGYIDNVFNGDTINGYDQKGIRGMLDWDISENSSLRLIAEYYDAEDDCCVDLEVLPSGRNPASAAASNSAGIVNGVADLDLDQRRVDHDFRTVTEDKTKALSLQFDSSFGEYEFVSITAFRNWENTEFREGDFTSIAGDSTLPVFGVPFQLHDVGPQEWDQFSQEVRIASPVGEIFEYQVGAFYWNIESDRSFTREASCQNNGGQNDAILAANPGLTCNANDIVAATADMSTEFENWAVFADSKYNVNDNFRVLFGLRYTSDDLDFTHMRRNTDPFGRRGVGVRPRVSDGNNQFDTDFSGSTNETNLSGKLGFQWNTGDTGQLYGTYSMGYKGPAFNVFYNMDSDDLAPILAEESDVIEIGYKYTTPTLQANVALFRSEIEDFQANDFDSSDGTTVTGFTNGGDVITEGIEFDFMWSPIDALLLTGGFSYIDAETDPDTGPSFPLPFASDVKVTLGGQYEILLDSEATVRVNASYSYTDEILSGNIGQTATANPEVLLPDYSLVDASVSYIFPDDKYAITLIGKNLTDEQYVTTYSGDSFRYQIPRDAERYFGVSFRANF